MLVQLRQEFILREFRCNRSITMYCFFKYSVLQLLLKETEIITAHILFFVFWPANGDSQYLNNVYVKYDRCTERRKYYCFQRIV